jgi:hypothetical protein
VEVRIVINDNEIDDDAPVLNVYELEEVNK